MKLCKVVLWSLLSTGAVAADQTAPHRWDFAWGMELELADSSPFYRLALPLQVYTGVVRPDLGDLRVLNGQGSVVPQHLELSPVRRVGEASVAGAKVFPLYASRESDIESILIQAPRALREDQVRIETREHFTASGEVLHGYILQLDGEEVRPLKKLHLDWRVDSQGFVHRLKVETSQDLEHWRTHNPNAVIADLRYGGERLLKQAIPLGNVRAKYLRLSPVGDSRLIDLSSASVEYAGETREVTPNRWPLKRIEPADRTGEYLFELPGPLSVVSLDIPPVEMNTLLRATLYSRADPEQPWGRRGSGLIYKLIAEGEALQQTELPVSRTQDRYWKLVVDTSGGGFGDRLPEMTLGWTPHTLLFAARGAAPFTLVYGSGRVGPVSGSALASGLEAHRMQSLTSENVRIARRFELSGPAALSTRVEPDWKRWSLWSVLVLGAGILGWMAWSTLRQLRD